METFIPSWFYGFDSLIYIFATIIGFSVSFQLFRLHKVTSQKSHLRLYFGMVVLSIGFLALSIVNVYTYTYSVFCVNCEMMNFDEMFGVHDLGYWFYYIASIIAYLLILTIYLPEKGQFLMIGLPVWFVGFKIFNLLSLLILSYIIFRTVLNYFSNRNIYTFLVMFSFLTLCGYHVLLLFAYWYSIFYVLAHASLLISFLSFLFMLKVSTK